MKIISTACILTSCGELGQVVNPKSVIGVPDKFPLVIRKLQVNIFFKIQVLKKLMLRLKQHVYGNNDFMRFRQLSFPKIDAN